MSAMHEQVQQLVRSADRPDVSLQILGLDGPGAVCGELSTVSRFGPDNNLALQEMMSTGCPGKGFSVGDRKETYLRLIACWMLAMTSLDSGWSGGQREP